MNTVAARKEKLLEYSTANKKRKTEIESPTKNSTQGEKNDLGVIEKNLEELLFDDESEKGVEVSGNGVLSNTQNSVAKNSTNFVRLAQDLSTKIHHGARELDSIDDRDVSFPTNTKKSVNSTPTPISSSRKLLPVSLQKKKKTISSISANSANNTTDKPLAITVPSPTRKLRPQSITRNSTYGTTLSAASTATELDWVEDPIEVDEQNPRNDADKQDHGDQTSKASLSPNLSDLLDDLDHPEPHYSPPPLVSPAVEHSNLELISTIANTITIGPDTQRVLDKSPSPQLLDDETKSVFSVKSGHSVNAALAAEDNQEIIVVGTGKSKSEIEDEIVAVERSASNLAFSTAWMSGEPRKEEESAQIIISSLKPGNSTFNLLQESDSESEIEDVMDGLKKDKVLSIDELGSSDVEDVLASVKKNLTNDLRLFM
ncbi:hypothetical protein HK098_001455 [Nowakowskiella sp. JEL0407]|nr:hypothetical protein HK098_001455 [Nowakowskiella sp. JEL0407]